MKINDGFNKKEVTSSLEAMDACMAGITSILIEPAIDRDQLSEEQAETLGLIGTALKELAQRAEAYDQLQSGKIDGIFRN